MKLPKGFIYFLIVAQALITLGHYAVYSALMAFFPALAAHHVLWLAVFILLSVSFLTMTILTFQLESPWLRPFYILAAIWLPIFFYFLLASLLTIIILWIWPMGNNVVPVVLFAVAILACVYGLVNARIARVIKVQVSLPNLPPAWKGKTAVMVSDLHLGHVLREGFAQKIINNINALKPEIVFFPGDFFDGAKTDFNHLANLFKQVKSTHGIYYVTGNHEEIAGYKVCEQAVAGAGMHILENQKTDIDGLQIAGLAYYSESQETPGRVKDLLGQMQLDPQKPAILLKHVPNNIPAIAAAGISLQLSGHTHLGQVWPFRYITKRVYKGFDYGLKQLGQFQIYTSSGAGTWGPPMRVFTKSEIVVLYLS
jgi:predicted MPP superfamily phosphohydrolase